MRLFVGLLAVVPLGSLPAHAVETAWTVSAPPGSAGPTAVVRYEAGTVSLAVTYGGRTVLEPAPVGIVTEQVDLASWPSRTGTAWDPPNATPPTAGRRPVTARASRSGG